MYKTISIYYKNRTQTRLLAYKNRVLTYQFSLQEEYLLPILTEIPNNLFIINGKKYKVVSEQLTEYQFFTDLFYIPNSINIPFLLLINNIQKGQIVINQDINLFVMDIINTGRDWKVYLKSHNQHIYLSNTLVARIQQIYKESLCTKK